MLLHEAEHQLCATPYRHQSQEDGQIFAGSPTTLAFSIGAIRAGAGHDFFHTTTMAVSEG